jgi:hypothetical protein
MQGFCHQSEKSPMSAVIVMTNQVEIFVSPDVFARLQQLAVPLADNTDSVIAKLIPGSTDGNFSACNPLNSRAPKVMELGTGDS